MKFIHCSSPSSVGSLSYSNPVETTNLHPMTTRARAAVSNPRSSMLRLSHLTLSHALSEKPR